MRPGVEVNPMSHFARQTKVDWLPDPDGLEAYAEQVADTALAALARAGISDITPLAATGTPAGLRTLPPETLDLLLTDSVSPLPLHKALVLVPGAKGGRWSGERNGPCRRE